LGKFLDLLLTKRSKVVELLDQVDPKSGEVCALTCLFSGLFYKG
jgi:hypothetical protein